MRTPTSREIYTKNLSVNGINFPGNSLNFFNLDYKNLLKKIILKTIIDVYLGDIPGSMCHLYHMYNLIKPKNLKLFGSLIL